MKKLLSLLLIFIVITPIITISPILAITDKTIYKQIDLSSVANGKFWVDSTNSSELTLSQYAQTDFASADGTKKLAALWPLQFPASNYREGHSGLGSTFPAQNGTINGNILTSKSSGVPYTMPEKTETVAEKEAIVLNKYGADAQWGGKGAMISNATLNISGNYDKLHFLVGSFRTGGTADITAIVTYTDGDTSVLSNANLPSGKNTDQSSNANFVADLGTAGGGGDGVNNLNKTYVSTWTAAYRLALYEYSVKLKPEKTVKSVRFETNRSGCTPSVVIASVVAETNLKNGYDYSDITVSDGKVSVGVSAPVDCSAILAVYPAQNTNKIIATGITELSAFEEKKQVIAYDKNISSAGDYIIKLFMWDKNLKPLYDENIFINEQLYESVNLKNASNGKFYIDPNDETELLLSTYNNTSNKNGVSDFSWYSENISSKVAAVYPASLTEGNATLEEFVIHSPSGIDYTLPEKTENVSEKEVITLSYWYSGDIDVDIADDVYSKIHFIAASALYSEAKFKVITNYTDGSCDISDEMTVYKHFETSAMDNFVATLNKMDSVNSDTNSFKRDFVKLSLYEYSIDVNPKKVVDSITFTCVDPSTFTTLESAGGRTFSIPAVTTQKLGTLQLKNFVENKIATSEFLNQEADALYRLTACLEKRGIDTNNIEGYDDLTQSTSKRNIYVATAGSDTYGDGTISSPFKTIDKVCEYISNNSDYLGSWNVLLREGRYYIEEGIDLNEDTLKNFSSVVFSAFENENVIISGSEKIDMTKAIPVNDSIKTRLRDSAKDKVVQVDLTEQGITNITQPTLAGYMKARESFSQIIIDDTSYNVARWPNSSYAIIDKCLNDGKDGNAISFTVAENTNELSNKSKWHYAENAILNGFFSDYDWKMDIIGVSSFSPETNSITTSNNPGVTIGTMDSPRRFFIENLVEEIDAPGEWYIDNDNILYIYPVSENSEVYISTLSDTMIEVSNINNVHFENLTFNGTVSSALHFDRAKNCEIKNCNIKNISSNAVSFYNCYNTGIVSSDLSYIGKTGVAIYDSNYTNMRDNNIYITDNKINKFATLSRNGTGTAITATHTIGTKISNNKIYDAPWVAILMDDAINMTIEYNDIFDVQQDYGDAGAIYTGQSYISQGNTIRYNYIHDLEPYSSDINGYVSGIYMDDMVCGFNIYGNVISKAPIGILLGGGKNLTVSNNIIMHNNVTKALCPINADDRGLNWASATSSVLMNELNTFIVKYPLHANNFKHLTEKYYTTQEFCGYPANNTITNNFFYNAENAKSGIYDIYYDSTHKNSVSGNYSYGENWLDYLSGSPFVNENNGDFTIKDNSIISKRIPGFTAIPFDKIGLLTNR